MNLHEFIINSMQAQKNRYGTDMRTCTIRVRRSLHLRVVTLYTLEAQHLLATIYEVFHCFVDSLHTSCMITCVECYSAKLGIQNLQTINHNYRNYR